MSNVEEDTKRCEQLIKPEHANWIGISNQLAIGHLIERIKELEDMLKEKDKEIEHQIEKRNNQKQELAILNEKQKEMNKLINTVSSYKGMLKKEQKDNEKKDKIIDLMAEYLIGVHIDNYDPTWEHEFEKDNFIILRSKEEVKQYFERKSEE